MIITVVIVVVRFSGTAKNFDGYLMGLEISIAVLTCVALAVIIIFNKSSYRKRHNSQMHLTNRYQLDENIRVGNYLMPVAINQMLIKIMLVVLTAYAVFFTAFSLGEEEDFVYHAYCQLFVYERLFFVLVLILRNTAFINAFIMGLQIGTVILSFANREEMTSALLALPVATFDSEQRIKNVVGRFFQALIVIIVFNKSSYNKRHDARIHLNSRYQLDENIRVGRYLIPVACNDLLTKVIFSILISYSVFFTDIPLGRDTTHLSHAYDLVPLLIAQVFAMYLAISAWLIMIIERAAASVYVIAYEMRFKGYPTSIILCVSVLLLTALLYCLSTFLRNTAFINAFLMGLQIGIVILSFTALVVIIVFNKTSYKKRHDARIHLNSRYQIDENIRVGKYLIPVACNDMLTKVIFLMLISYSIFFTDIPLGQDTTHLSHAYDLLSAYQRMFFGLALTLRSQKFDRIMKRHNKTAAVVQKDTAATYNYYDDLRRMW
ncbi:hypothetical protein GCK32_002854 [Trichostrongylus colubriformis]|uniref:G protein-coupled receptor n=1 Tax=Trichostrongylus colubriformis TaxID=6319 RepID=A0AAN8F4G1_TRICO